MRLWTLALAFVIAVVYSEAKTVEELKALADRAGAPFTTVALERMGNIQLWGAKRAARSADLVIINKSGMSFKLVGSQCDRCSPSSGLLPESNLDGQTSTVVGFQSSGNESYTYIHCGLTYAGGQGGDRKSFRIAVYPKDIGGDVTGHGVAYSDGIKITLVDTSIDTNNNNNQVVLQVQLSKNYHDSPLKLIRGAAPVRQRKSKGSRNMLVKASKRGNSVRTM